MTTVPTGIWTFDFQTTDRQTWPALWGRVVVQAEDYPEAFMVAHDMVYCLNGKRRLPWLPPVAMVTALYCVDWPEKER